MASTIYSNTVRSAWRFYINGQSYAVSHTNDATSVKIGPYDVYSMVETSDKAVVPGSGGSVITASAPDNASSSVTEHSTSSIDMNKTFTFARTHSTRTVNITVTWQMSDYEIWSGTSHSTYSDTATLTVPVSVPARPSYAVSFNANGGSGAPSAQTKWYGEALALSSAKPARDGYVFKSWNTAADGSGTGYAPGASYAANAAVTLYAVWAKLPTVSIGSVKRVNEDGVEDAAGGYALVSASWASDTAVTARTVSVGPLSRSLGAAGAGSGEIDETLGDGTNVYPLTSYACTVAVTNSAGTTTATYALAADPGYFEPVVELRNVRRAEGTGTAADALAKRIAAEVYWKVCETDSQDGPKSPIPVEFERGLGTDYIASFIGGLAPEDTASAMSPNDLDYADIPPAAGVSPIASASVSDKFYTTTVTADLAATDYTAPSVSNVEVYRSGFDGTAEDEGLTATVTVDWSMHVTALNAAPQSFSLTAYDQDGAAVAQKALSVAPGGSGTVRTSTSYTFTEFDKTPANTGGAGEVFATDAQYTVTVEIADLYASAARSDVLSSAYFTFDVLRGGHGVAFGKPAAREAFDVRMDAYFENGVHLAKQAHVAERLDLPTYTYSGKPALADAPCLPCIVVDVSDYSVWLYEAD